MKLAIEQVDEQGLIFKITETYFREHANLFLFKGSRFDVLFDCGLGLFDVRAHLNSAGFTNIKVALTHAHFDHCGGLRYFPMTDIIAPSKVLVNLGNPELWGVEYLRPEDFIPVDCGLSPEEIAAFCSDFNVDCLDIAEYRSGSVDNGNFVFDIVEMPGHTNDSVVYLERTQGILVSGDALYQGEAYCDCPNSSLVDLMHSLDRMAGMDFRLLLPGHNKVLNRLEAGQVIAAWNNVLRQKMRTDK